MDNVHTQTCAHKHARALKTNHYWPTPKIVFALFAVSWPSEM